MKKLDPMLPQMIAFLVLIPALFALFICLIIRELPQYFWITVSFYLVDLIVSFVLFATWYRDCYHAPIYLSSDGIRVPEGLIRWDELKITVRPQHFYRTCYLLAHFDRRPLTEAEVTRKSKPKNFARLTRRNLELILEYYPNRFYYTFITPPPSYYLAMHRMIRMMDRHNRSVLEKQEKEITP